MCSQWRRGTEHDEQVRIEEFGGAKMVVGILPAVAVAAVSSLKPSSVSIEETMRW